MLSSNPQLFIPSKVYWRSYQGHLKVKSRSFQGQIEKTGPKNLKKFRCMILRMLSSNLLLFIPAKVYWRSYQGHLKVKSRSCEGLIEKTIYKNLKKCRRLFLRILSSNPPVNNFHGQTRWFFSIANSESTSINVYITTSSVENHDFLRWAKNDHLISLCGRGSFTVISYDITHNAVIDFHSS